MRITYGNQECDVKLSKICEKPMYDAKNIVCLHDYVCVPCLICKYNKLQHLFAYISHLMGYSTKEYKERELILIIPVSDEGIINIDDIKCTALRFVYDAEIMQTLISTHPQMLLDTEMSPVELLTLSSLFILHNNGNYYTHIFV